MTKLDKFNELYKKWYDETCFHSRIDLIYDNDNFRKIIDMGIEVVPFIIDKLEVDSNSYFLVKALDILCPNVVTYKGYVPLEDAAKFWIQIWKNEN